MGYEDKIIQAGNPLRNDINKKDATRTIFYGEVIDIVDETQGGRIKVRILDIDNATSNNNLPWAYPMLPKFFHIYPKVGEMVRIFFEDVRYTERGRFWMGSIISQPQKIDFDSFYTALSTTNMAISAPEKAPYTFPDAVGVYPNIEDVAIVGRVNTDIILRVNDLEIRAGQHEPDDLLKLNKKNPASIRLTFDKIEESENYISTNVIMADRIGIVSHDGTPKLKAALLNAVDRNKIFEQGHPIPRGDVLVEILKIFRDALVQHIHGYSGLPADVTNAITNLQNINFEGMLQKNIVIN
jgi:hypothetical protein